MNKKIFYILVLVVCNSAHGMKRTAVTSDSALVRHTPKKQKNELIVAIDSGSATEVDKICASIPERFNKRLLVQAIARTCDFPEKQDKEGAEILRVLFKHGGQAPAMESLEHCVESGKFYQAHALLEHDTPFDKDCIFDCVYAGLVGCKPRPSEESTIAIVKSLLEKGVSLESPVGQGYGESFHGGTILMLAADLGCGQLVHFLLDKKAQVHAQDKQGKSAISLAFARGNEEMMTLLRNAQAEQREQKTITSQSNQQ